MPYQPEFLLRVYRTMKTIRIFEERCIKEFEGGNIPGFVHASNGQEAIAVAACIDLTYKDIIGSTHRGHGHCIAKGCDVIGMMKEIMGKATGLCKGKGGSMHIADFDKGMIGANAIVGGGPPLCNGAALGAKTRGTKDIAMSFSGDGSANQGTVLEALNFAAVLKLPHVFIFENNGYGEGTSANYALGCDSLAERNGAFGMPSEYVDGTDFFATYEACQRAIQRARQGEGPSSIEAETVRFDGHFIGDPQLYRGKNEIADAKVNRDCLTLFRNRVLAESWLQAPDMDAIDEEVELLIASAVQEGLNAPDPDPAIDLMADVYCSY
ncbi:thiamine pyrophosphate-dependent dehydrogenase E1 component subunit alpha [Aestuariicella hydrocarbonica]|uniref:Thiamine pyrophosphate-dependent dehydrogenase E1 component subunit alpha n=1 Tax=Pseudomaricurvus hydrocarbonicus TaxID=1470433 RepID=A0A9E5MMI7_9GAMM|nr:thiamine pyrophosphate-dependent dehydrogenase E1 component subunit alpha [Aestuariicella hydrocarbonica]NHO66830.1 thiamine pyrophosphate-dependent dehydrogenase E1 component subunit alpha [Aestuariicella hydrocarbonica]